MGVNMGTLPVFLTYRGSHPPVNLPKARAAPDKTAITEGNVGTLPEL